MLRDSYNVQFEGTIVRTTPEPRLLTENNVQRDQGWSWIVLFAAFLALFITNGMHVSFGILYAALISHFNSGREETAWIGSISLGLLCFFSPVASVLIEQIGCRVTSIIGAFLCSLGFFISSFATGIALLYFSHGLLFGLGTSLTYTAAMTVVSRSFERRRNIATGLCTSGSQFGGISLAPLSQVLWDRLGYANTFRTFSGLLLVVAIFSLVYRSELGGNTSRPPAAKKSPKDMLNVWKSKAYIVWALGTTMVTLGYNIPRYTLAKYAIDQGISKDASAWLLSYLCASSAIGRITFGRLCEWFPNLYLCQACIIGCAVSSFLYPFLKSYLALVITCIISGLPDGGFVASLCLVTTEIVGPDKMVEGFGFMLFCQSYSNVLGPPLSGMLYDTYKSYKASFCFAAVPEIIGALMLFLIPYYRRNQVQYTHEIEDNSNSGILVNAGNSNAAETTLNPISKDAILPTVEEPHNEYNVVINLASVSPDVRLLSVVISKTNGTDTTGVACNESEIDQLTQDGGILKQAADEIEIPLCTRECSSTVAAEVFSPVDDQGHESRGASIGNEVEPIICSGPTKSSSTQTVIHDGSICLSIDTQYTNNSKQTVNQDKIIPSVLTQEPSVTTSYENESQIIDVGVEMPAQTFPSQQLVAIASNKSQTDLPGARQSYEGTDIVNISLEPSASVVRVCSNTVSLIPEGDQTLVKEIINLPAEQEVPKISPPPPSHKHHVTNTKAEGNTGCHDNVIEGSPEAMLAELDTLVQGSELPTATCLTTGFAPEVNNQQMKCSGFAPEYGPSQNQESLMLSSNFIPELTSSPLTTSFCAEPSRVTCGGINDVLTQKQLPEPLKPTSLSSMRENEHQSNNTPEVPPATSPLSCELSTVIADVIQSLTSQHTASHKSTKESVISNMADNPHEDFVSADHFEKKQANVFENSGITTRDPVLNINNEFSRQASSDMSSYSKLQTSVLHSMQNIVAEGCPEDVALLEDISIDLTLDKDPSFASVVLIDDVDEQNTSGQLKVPCLSHEPAITQHSRSSGQEPLFAGLSVQEPAIIHTSTVSHEPVIAQSSVIPTQEQPFSGSTYEHAITHASGISNQEHYFPGAINDPAIVQSSEAANSVLHDAIVLEFYPQTTGQDSISSTASREHTPKPIESTNPFYQDLNQ